MQISLGGITVDVIRKRIRNIHLSVHPPAGRVRMRTRWGTCNSRSRSIRLNTELVKKPMECLEYVVVHEMVHLLEASHNARFKALMSRYMPNWSVYRQMLNRLPGRHETWDY